MKQHVITRHTCAVQQQHRLPCKAPQPNQARASQDASPRQTLTQRKPPHKAKPSLQAGVGGTDACRLQPSVRSACTA
jgi:hypothetical protein